MLVVASDHCHRCLHRSPLPTIPITAELTRSLDGRKERVQFDKITARVSRLCYGLEPDHVDPAAITMKVIAGVYQGVTTVQLDDLVCAVEEAVDVSTY